MPLSVLPLVKKSFAIIGGFSLPIYLDNRAAVQWLSAENHLLKQPRELPRMETEFQHQN